MASTLLDRELKRGSAELLILALIEQRPRHGYDISQLIEQRSEGAISRRYYRLTRAGRKVLANQRSIWQTFFAALDRVAGINPAHNIWSRRGLESTSSHGIDS